MNPLPDPCFAPPPEDGVDRLPLGKVQRQLPPLATGANQIEDRIQDRSPVDRWTTKLRTLRQQRSNQLPLFVGQVAGIMLARRYGSVFLDLITQEAES